MANNINDEFLKSRIEGYIKDNGWNGFFGLLATISPDKVDKSDLEEYEEKMTSYNNTSTILPPTQFENPAYNSPIKEASIYAEEHIMAVQDDLREQGLVESIEETEVKTKVLEPSKSSTPNPWGDSKVVLPGELDL